MTWVVFLDTGVLGYITHPKGNAESTRCTQWLLDLLDQGVRVCIPEVCDYELRRGYIHREKHRALAKLDDLRSTLEYVPIDSDMMAKAAKLWAEARQRGTPTADEKELDIDVILAAQAHLTTSNDDTLTIATTNVGHLSQFSDARRFQDIPPR